MRRSARFTAGMEAMVLARVGALREHLVRAQKELEQARSAVVKAISAAEASGAEEEDLEALRAAKAVLTDSPAGEHLQQLEAQVEQLLPRVQGG